MDRLQAMRVYARVAQLGSFTRAADDLGMSRAAVSESVATLEAHLGARLLARTTRQVVPTAEGAEYLQRCVRILGEVESAESAVRGVRDRPHGLLRVDVPTSFGRVLLMPALPRFLQRYPELQLDVRFNDRVVDLVAERVDVALRAGAVKAPNLVVRRIATTRRVICAAPSYLKAAGVPERPEDLRHHRLVAVSSGATGRPIEWTLRGARLPKLQFAAVFNLAEAQLEAAIGGAGLVQTVDLLAGEEIARGRLRTVLDAWSGEGPPISLVSVAAAHRSAKVRVFSDFAAELLTKWRERLVSG
jgi:LysR family transcriptional regulator for bpeEF and oprC